MVCYAVHNCTLKLYTIVKPHRFYTAAHTFQTESGKYRQMGALKCMAHALIPHCRQPLFSGGVIESDAVS